MKRRGYQVAYSATSTNPNPTRWNEFIIDVDFQTICRDEGASSQRVPNISSVLRTPGHALRSGAGHGATTQRVRARVHEPNSQYLDDLQAQRVCFSCDD